MKGDKNLQIWTEKYRPKALGDVVDQKHAVDRLKAWVKEGSIPHLIFAGAAGVGKTTTAVCLARELFGEHWRENFQETNASEARGIDVVRGRIKEFAMTKPMGAPFKIIFLDESDSLTSEAQQALRRTMEKFSETCRFILSCNYSSKIISPIQSRCSVFRFKNLSKENVNEYLSRVANGEKLELSQDAVDAIYEISEGDLRKATNLLQAGAATGSVTKDAIYKVAAQAKPEDVKEMMVLALSGKFSDARKMLRDMVINQGLSGQDIVRNLHREIFALDLQDQEKIKLVASLGETEYRINSGGSDDIQIEAFLAQAALLKAK